MDINTPSEAKMELVELAQDQHSKLDVAKRDEAQESGSSKKFKFDDEKYNESITPGSASAKNLSGTGDGGEKNQNKLARKVVFGLDYVIQQFGKIGSGNDLRMLRQSAEAYYKKLNPIYWDFVEHTIVTSFRGRSVGSQSFDIQIWGCPLEKQYKEITANIWSTEIQPIVHTFRNLILDKIVIPIIPITDLKLTDITTPIAPYITYLQLEEQEEHIGPKIDGHPKLTGHQLVEFFQQFKNLIKIEIIDLSALRMDDADPGKHLQVILQSLNPSIQVQIRVGQNYESIFNQCDCIPNIKWIVDISGGLMGEKMGRILPMFSRRPYLNVNFNIEDQRVVDLDGLRRTVQLCLEFQDKINTIELDLNFRDFENQDEPAVKNCLGALSQIVNVLDLNFRDKKWNIANGTEATWSWPNILDLTVYSITAGVNFPFVIMKCSPNLAVLILFVDQDLCIFVDPEKSDEQCIKEFFGNLIKLEYLGIHDGRISRGNELEGFLKSLLPELFIDYN